LADVCRKIKAAAIPKSPPQTQAEHDALVSAISSYNLPSIEPGMTRFFLRIQYAGTLNMGIKTRLFRQAVGELISAERIFPPEHNPSTNTCTYEYRVR
jgi:hypothetical protein